MPQRTSSARVESTADQKALNREASGPAKPDSWPSPNGSSKGPRLNRGRRNVNLSYALTRVLVVTANVTLTGTPALAGVKSTSVDCRAPTAETLTAAAKPSVSNSMPLPSLEIPLVGIFKRIDIGITYCCMIPPKISLCANIVTRTPSSPGTEV